MVSGRGHRQTERSRGSRTPRAGAGALRCARSPPCRARAPTSYPLACSVSSSLSPSIPHVSWSSSSRLCWLAADSLSSAIAAAPSGWGGGAPRSKQGSTGRARPQLPLVPPTLGHRVWSLRPRPSRRSRPSQPARPDPAHSLAAPACLFCPAHLSQSGPRPQCVPAPAHLISSPTSPVKALPTSPSHFRLF